MEKTLNLEEINIDFAKKYLDKYEGKNIPKNKDEYEHYREEDKVIKFLFRKAYPNNTVYEEILTKVLILNVFYSTQIMAPRAVAQKICNCEQIDERIQKGNEDVVNDIATITFNTKTGEIKKRCFYSFATKYCCNSNPEKYPIYDKNVAYILKLYNKKDKFAEFKNSDLKNYAKFKEIIDKFRDHYKLNDLNYRDLDHFLWTYGKEKLDKKTGNNDAKHHH